MWKMACSNCGTKDLGRTGSPPIMFASLMFCNKNCGWSYFLNIGDENIIQRFHRHVNDLIEAEQTTVDEMKHSTSVIKTDPETDSQINNLQCYIMQNVVQNQVVSLSTRNNIESGHTVAAFNRHTKLRNPSKLPPKDPSVRKTKRKVSTEHDEDFHCFGNALYEYCLRREAVRRLV